MLPSRCKCSCKSLAKHVARISNCRRSQSLFEAITTAGPLSCRWSKDMVTLGVLALLGAKAAPRHSIEVMSPIYNWSLWLQLSCDRARCGCVRLTGCRGLMSYFIVDVSRIRQEELAHTHWNKPISTVKTTSYFILHTCDAHVIVSHGTSLKACSQVTFTFYESPASWITLSS